MFITGCIHVEDHLVTVHKDIKLPIRCIKCQEYGQMHDSCIGVEGGSRSHSHLRVPRTGRNDYDPNPPLSEVSHQGDARIKLTMVGPSKATVNPSRSLELPECHECINPMQ